MAANTVQTFFKQKKNGEKISMVTCYDYSMATLVEKAGINCVLVGDSLGMVMMGLPDTLSVTMEDMVHHSVCVSRGLKDTFLITDMPFMSYQVSVEEAVRNAGRIMKEGRAQAVKLEGGADVVNEIRAITAAGIPVCGHLGMTPQSVNAFGGFKVQGKDAKSAKRILDDAKAIEEAGAFMVVLECIPSDLAELITESLEIPTIGIGAGAECDGQVLVYQDMFNMFDGFKPKFAKEFADVGATIVSGFKNYDEAVKAKEFPALEHSFTIDEAIIKELKNK